MSIYQQQPIDLSRVETYPLASRPSKVTVRNFAKTLTDDEARSAAALLNSLPRILAAATLRSITDAIIEAKSKNRAILWGVGGHVIKTGLTPILIALARRGFVSAVAMNGSGVIHDFEIAVAGWTSEDVDAALGSGAF